MWFCPGKAYCLAGLFACLTMLVPITINSWSIIPLFCPIPQEQMTTKCNSLKWLLKISAPKFVAQKFWKGSLIGWTSNLSWATVIWWLDWVSWLTVSTGCQLGAQHIGCWWKPLPTAFPACWSQVSWVSYMIVGFSRTSIPTEAARVTWALCLAFWFCDPALEATSLLLYSSIYNQVIKISSDSSGEDKEPTFWREPSQRIWGHVLKPLREIFQVASGPARLM